MAAPIPAPVFGVSFGFRPDGAAGDVLRPGEVFRTSDGSGGVVSLPPARSTGGSLILCLSPNDGTPLKIVAFPGDTIDGDALYTLVLPQRSQMLVSLGGSEWRLL